MSDSPRRLAVDGWRDVRPPRFIEVMAAQRVPYKQARRTFDGYYAIALLQQAGGNRSHAARNGGMHRNTLLNVLARLLRAGLSGLKEL